MSIPSKKVRLYNLAKELKVDTKRLIEMVRRHGVDVSIPSNSISPKLAQQIRDERNPLTKSPSQRVVRLIRRSPVRLLGSENVDVSRTSKKKKIRRCPVCAAEMRSKAERRGHLISDHPNEVLEGTLLAKIKVAELRQLIPATFGDLARAATLAGSPISRDSDQISAELVKELVRHLRLTKEKLHVVRATTRMELKHFDELAQRDFGQIRELIDDCLKGRLVKKVLQSFATEDANLLKEYARILEWKIGDLPAHSAGTRIVRRINEDIDIYLKRGGTRFGAKKLNWKLLPKGKQPFKKLLEHFERISKQPAPIVFDIDRLYKVYSLRPDDVFVGIDEFQGYVVFYFGSAETAILDCPVTGNAIYVFGENWKSLSYLTKTALLSGRGRDVTRIVHYGAWFSRLQTLLQSRRSRAAAIRH